MSTAIAAHEHRTRLHVLRDRLKRAVRDQKRGLAGGRAGGGPPRQAGGLSGGTSLNGGRPARA